MKYQNKIFMAGLLCCLLQNQMLYGNQPTSVEIIPLKSTIMIGEPLLIKVICKFEKPCTDDKTGDIPYQIRCDAFPLIEAKEHDYGWLSNSPDGGLIKLEEGEAEYYALPQMYPSSLSILDNNGAAYGDYYAIFYNRYKKGAVFDNLGTYKLCISIATDKMIFSNIIEIKVNPVVEQEKCALSDPNEYNFITGIESKIFKDPTYRSKIISDLKTLVKQHPDSILAKWSAARIGLESFYDAEKKRDKARREKTGIETTIWDDANRCLQEGLELPDDFPVRQEVLYRLCEIECAKKNYSRAILYMDELGTKYPKGKYGKNAVRSKEELIKLEAKEKNP